MFSHGSTDDSTFHPKAEVGASVDGADCGITSDGSPAVAVALGWNSADSIGRQGSVATAHSLEPPLKLECRHFDKSEWDAVLAGFQDANLYQTWAYAAVRWGSKNLTHLVLKDGQATVGAAQVILAKLPAVKAGLAYVKWGPLWVARARRPDPQVLRQLLRALGQVFAQERGYLLRVAPWEFEDTTLAAIPLEEGFRRNSLIARRTAVLELTHSMETLRASLSRHWRANLKRAERNNLEVVEGCAEDFLEEFSELYRQMRVRKDGWIPPIHYLGRIQRELTSGMKAHTFICKRHDKAVAGLVISALGEKAFAWLAATGDAGQDSRGSYLLQWRAIERLKSLGVRTYDLGGVDEITHPGTTQFKLGLCGRLGRTLSYLGEFEACQSWPSRLIIGGSDQFRLRLLRIQQFCQEHWHALRSREQIEPSWRGEADQRNRKYPPGGDQG